MRRMALLAALALSLLAGCNKGPDPYRQAGNPPGQNPRGTPADRTGGATNRPDPAGGATLRRPGVPRGQSAMFLGAVHVHTKGEPHGTTR
jgi:hypothetical protein